MDYSKRAEMQHHQPSNPSPSSANHYAQLYSAHQSSSYAIDYPYYSYQTHNPNLVDPQAQYGDGPETGLRPPGIDPYAAINSHPLPPTHVGSDAQPAVNYGYHVPQIGELSAAAYYQDPVSYAAAIKSLNKESEVPTSLTPTVWNNWNPPLANDATKIILAKTNVMQTVRCEICKIECNNKDVYAQHILGKKHKRNLKEQEESRIDSNALTTTTLWSNPGTTEIGNLSGGVGNAVGGKMIMGNRASAFGEGLESKRRKLVEGVAAFDSTMVCTICNIECNSQVVFNSHLAGKRHAIQASLRSNGMQPLVAANPNSLGWSKPIVNGTWRKHAKKTKIVQSVWCGICKIDCNSKDVLDKHKLGKKHKKNLEKLEESKKEASAPAAKNTMIGPKQNPAADKGKAVSLQEGKMKGAPSLGPGEDLETKRRKVMEGGAAADAVRVCTVCNVVCNSQTVFTYHLAGQKHITNMVKKQTATAATAATANPPGPGVVPAT
ncbi:hypothetical protein NE237_021633 [Protea cynaroides]|uniref:Uncharacterized protein n=1 Tax=Protea cynaroides TaxID=273540 RepID=A0A9Q0H8W8_9MAGN|nr:hypothetical protein NE237_021633 [Protea cynaroides]